MDNYKNTIPINYGSVEGDDEVTQIIPQNHGMIPGNDEVTQMLQGDDEVTQIIPQNHDLVQGDDDVTQLISNNATTSYTPAFLQYNDNITTPCDPTTPQVQTKSKKKSGTIGVIIFSAVLVAALIVALILIL